MRRQRRERTVEEEDLKASARRVAEEPFFQHLIDDLRDSGTAQLERAATHEDLLRAQAWHQAASEVEAAVRRAAKP